MDCLQAREIVSEAFDRGVGATDGVEEARAHCRTCPECRTFVEGLVALQKAPRPKAPETLVAGILDRARLMAEHADEMPKPAVVPVVVSEEQADTAEAGAGASEPGQPAPEGVRPSPSPGGNESGMAGAAAPSPRDKWWWVPRASAIAGAAAVVVVAVAIAMQGFNALSPSKPAGRGVPAAAPTDSSETRTDAYNVPLTSPGSVPSTADARAVAKSDSAAGPHYVSLDSRAYVSVGERSLDRSTLKSAGRLTSSLDTTMQPNTYDVWTSTAFPDVIFIEAPAGHFEAFQPVERKMAGRAYVLTGDVAGFGQWPALPSQFSTPTATDGSPTFVAAGRDDTGLQVYAPPGSLAQQGFAIAPGTSTSDPAGGNPGWTWWVPKP